MTEKNEKEKKGPTRLRLSKHNFVTEERQSFCGFESFSLMTLLMYDGDALLTNARFLPSHVIAGVPRSIIHPCVDSLGTSIPLPLCTKSSQPFPRENPRIFHGDPFLLP